MQRKTMKTFEYKHWDSTWVAVINARSRRVNVVPVSGLYIRRLPGEWTVARVVSNLRNMFQKRLRQNTRSWRVPIGRGEPRRSVFYFLSIYFLFMDQYILYHFGKLVIMSLLLKAIHFEAVILTGRPMQKD